MRHKSLIVSLPLAICRFANFLYFHLFNLSRVYLLLLNDSTLESQSVNSRQAAIMSRNRVTLQKKINATSLRLHQPFYS